MNGSPTPSNTQAEYSEESAPNQTGTQYSEYEIRSGESSAIAQRALPPELTAASTATAAESAATSATLDPRDKEIRNSRMANATFQPRAKCELTAAPTIAVPEGIDRLA